MSSKNFRLLIDKFDKIKISSPKLETIDLGQIKYKRGKTIKEVELKKEISKNKDSLF